MVGLSRTALLALLVAAWLGGAAGVRAAEVDAVQTLLRNTGLPAGLSLSRGEALTQEKARALWQGLVTSPVTPRSFAPRTVLAALLRQALASPSPLAYSELRDRAEHYGPLIVVRPDGYALAALTGHPIASLGHAVLREGELYVQGMRVGGFYYDDPKEPKRIILCPASCTDVKEGTAEAKVNVFLGCIKPVN